MKRSYEIDMCNGPLMGKLLRFSFPLICSGILQLLFNAADIVIVGRFSGSEALAAVGATSPFNSLIINLFTGFSVGCNILTARYYGAQDWKGVHDSVHTSMTLSVICGVLIAFIGIIFSRPILLLMGTPENVIDQSTLYMRILLMGVPALTIYNFGAAILRAVGDTRRPLFFLFTAGVLNVVLNLFFVIVLHMGVAGVALATMISQYVSAMLVVLCLIRGEGAYQLSIKELRLSSGILKQILRIGLPAALQGALFSLSNMVIQSSINSFGSTAMAGNTAASNIEGFIYTSMNAVYQASVSFTSQNMGAKKKERIVPIFGKCLLLVFIVGFGLGLIAVIFSKHLLSLYNTDPQVIAYGVDRLRVICITYVTCGLMEVACGMLRGMGYSLYPMIITLAGVCGLRIIWVFTVFSFFETQISLYVSYPVSWVITFLIHTVSFFILYRKWAKSV